jgi:hypothetical protein
VNICSAGLKYESWSGGSNAVSVRRWGYTPTPLIHIGWQAPMGRAADVTARTETWLCLPPHARGHVDLDVPHVKDSLRNGSTIGARRLSDHI